MSFRIRNKSRPPEPVPGELFCCDCLYQAPKEEFLLENRPPQCPNLDCGSDDVFDAWEEPEKWGFPPRLEHPPEPGNVFCNSCGNLGRKELFVDWGSSALPKRCPDCKEGGDLVDAAEAWRAQVFELGERGIVYDPEKGWCNRT